MHEPGIHILDGGGYGFRARATRRLSPTKARPGMTNERLCRYVDPGFRFAPSGLRAESYAAVAGGKASTE
ncbi:hypothetical protein V1281_006309 [Nitrobacteraceae bacterium AZCC 2161]